MLYFANVTYTWKIHKGDCQKRKSFRDNSAVSAAVQITDNNTQSKAVARNYRNMMKTAVTVLQEMMIKMNEVPKYECIAQSGPQHQATFEYRVSAQGVAVTGQARSKKEAKQEAARRML
ncbi:jg4243, partial [Pararge aegeria aegeria]